MATLDTFRRAVMAGITAFRQEYMSEGSPTFGSIEGRKTRYDILWAFYEQTVYDSIHAWAAQHKASYALYRYTRSIYNPAYRIGTFWTTHLMGGRLDPAAGNGDIIPTCLPIAVPSENTKGELLREAIAQVWDWSNWQKKKSIWTLNGTILGDAFLQPIDDVPRNKVYLEVLSPGLISDLDLDPFGNVKAYIMRYMTDDPNGSAKQVEYREDCFHGPGDEIIFQTFLDDVPYGWAGRPSTWTEPYGFIPLVYVPHVDVGKKWGLSELQAGLSKFRELDDLASKLTDHIRKSVDPPWLFNFAKPRPGKEQMPEPTPTQERPQPGREELPAIYVANENAKGQSLVAELDYGGALDHIKGVLVQLEKDYPELLFEAMRLGGDVSGETLRVARQPVEAKIVERRGSYDNALVKAQQMAVSIGAYRTLFPAFSVDSYKLGELDHTIGSRALFEVDPIAELEEQKIFWEVAKSVMDLGGDVVGWLQTMNWSDEKISKIFGPTAGVTP